MAKLLPPSTPSFKLQVAIIDGDILEFEYESDMAAKQDIDIIFYGSPGGVWDEATYYPVHRIESCTIIQPGEQE